ncbi:MAG: alpha-glucosidase C-terminal domain-containing protein [Saprospiraceae bacterium]|nr:alpha-glucosidase C-terminal domain-containing protein [Saprospiraceae bacterium]
MDSKISNPLQRFQAFSSLNIFIFFSLIALTWLAACQSQPSTNNSSTQRKPEVMTEPDWAKSAVLYELNVRQFSPEGNFAGVRAQLPRLKELGVDVIWLMPIHPIGVENRKGSLGSPYSVRDYLAVNPDYGTTDDLKALVSEAHQLGLKVILDWVPNHTSWDSEWKHAHPEYFTRYNGNFTVPLNEHGEPIADWSDVCDLDYAQPATRRAMIQAMQHWIKTCDIDGFRVDMAGLVPNDFWAECRPALDSVKKVFMLSEWQDEPAHFTSAFQCNYGWKWKDITKDIAAGKQNAQSLDTLIRFLDDFYPKDYYQLYFTQNHDENSWNGSEKELYGPAADAFNVLMFTWQGMPMLYCGQEDNLNQRLDFFEKDPIKWGKFEKTTFYQNLCALRHNNRALHSGKNGGQLTKISTNTDQAVYAFTREKEGDRVIVILNLSKIPQTVQLSPKEEMTVAFVNVFNNSTIQVTQDMALQLKPWEYLVLTNK